MKTYKEPNRTSGAEKYYYMKWQIHRMRLIDETAEEKINAFEDNNKSVWSKTENAKNWRKKRESLSELWDNIKQTHMYVIGVPEGKEKEE